MCSVSGLKQEITRTSNLFLTQLRRPDPASRSMHNPMLGINICKLDLWSQENRRKRIGTDARCESSLRIQNLLFK